MTIPMFHSLWTIVVLAIFIGIIFWAYSKRRHSDFEEAANLPLEDDLPVTNTDPKAEQQ
ncbi:MAG: cbb3-type cytochrome c oxidase subunit 3 [Gammaproteobacteria bacterium]|nr:cbb3-type cytochrome c oxidase subunit 3 [Gammaproteobacteria bacterium]